jgi:hypothetical protein
VTAWPLLAGFGRFWHHLLARRETHGKNGFQVESSWEEVGLHFSAPFCTFLHRLWARALLSTEVEMTKHDRNLKFPEMSSAKGDSALLNRREQRQ